MKIVAMLMMNHKTIIAHHVQLFLETLLVLMDAVTVVDVFVMNTKMSKV